VRWHSRPGEILTLGPLSVHNGPGLKDLDVFEDLRLDLEGNKDGTLDATFSLAPIAWVDPRGGLRLAGAPLQIVEIQGGCGRGHRNRRWTVPVSMPKSAA